MFYIDNYAKCFAVGLPTVRQGPIKNCLWTALGVFVPPFWEGFEQAHLAVQADHPGVPADLFNDDRVKELRRMYLQADDTNGALYDQSASRTIRTVPLTLVDDIGKPTRPNNKPTFCPLGIGEQNVGFNIGLIRNLKDLANRQQEMKCYLPILSDGNIFRRILSVRVHVCSITLTGCS
jgi:hypothetical protein